MNQTTNELLLFFGRFHPLLVHLPIGFLLVAFLMEVFAIFRRFAFLKQSTEFILFLAAGSSVLAALFGYFLSLSGGYDQDLLAKHQWLGVGVAALSVVAYVAKSQKIRAVYAPSLVAGCVVLTLAGHYGGELTHGSTYLTEHMPAPLRALVGLPPKDERGLMAAAAAPADPKQAVVFAHVVQPILRAKCENCHNANKQKGALRLDSYEHLLKGGEHGDIMAKGKSADSEMIKRCLLPEDNDDHMPPKGKPQLTKEELAILAWWIDQGGSPDQKLADLPQTTEIATALKTVGFSPGGGAPGGTPGAGPKAESPVYQKTVPAPDVAALQKLQALGVLAMPIAQESHLFRVQAGSTPLKGIGGVFGDQQLALLAPLAQNIVWLDLGNTKLTDAGLAQVAAMPNLVRLHLQNTAVTDAGLAQLGKLAHLEYLNLYGTAVTDAGLAQLAPLKHLRSLYLWQTKATEAGAKALRERLPALDVNQGFQLPDSLRAKPMEKKKA
jgi:uncharacterized membrane protein/mono/diheme cytochrome c family protein